MRPRTWTFLSALLFAALVPAAAWAQPCCAGAGVFSPTRLRLGEDWLLGTQLRGHSVTGTTNAEGRYLAAATNSTEQNFELAVNGTMRILDDGQLGLSVPLALTRRVVQGEEESGGGLGDLLLTGRYELIPPNTDERWPGIALVAGLSIPTGTAVEDARSPFATDATGQGAFGATLAADVERAFGNLLFDVVLGLGHRFAREVGGVRSEPGLQLIGTAAVGYAFYYDWAVALDGQLIAEQQVRINGAAAPGSERLLCSVGVSAGIPVTRHWRFRFRAYDDLPAPGKNQTAGPGLTASVMRTW